MELTRDNYHSLEMNKKYMGVSQFKSFLECEAKRVAINNGEWDEPDNPAFLLGGLVHAWNDGTMTDYRANNPGLFKKDGSYYAKYAIADKMIGALANDPLAEKAREGQKEVIMTGELFGVDWKIMIDIYNPEKGVFTDLKTCREIQKMYWSNEENEWVNFIIYYGYNIQMSVYAEIEKQNRGADDYLSPHILAVSKEDPPDKDLIYFDREMIPGTLKEKVKLYMPRVKEVWQGKAEPHRCGRCDYCRSTKKLTKPVHYLDIGER